MAKGIKTGGRQKGTPNKMTANVKAAVLEAFDRVGGPAYLEKVAQENPAVFCQLIGKVIPLQVGGDPEQPLRMEFKWAGLSKS